MVILIAFCAFSSRPSVGGLVALKLKDKLHLILGFFGRRGHSGGFSDLMPEAIDIGSKYYASATVPSIVALGFLVCLFLTGLFSFILTLTIMTTRMAMIMAGRAISGAEFLARAAFRS